MTVFSIWDDVFEFQDEILGIFDDSFGIFENVFWDQIGAEKHLTEAVVLRIDDWWSSGQNRLQPPNWQS